MRFLLIAALVSTLVGCGGAPSRSSVSLEETRIIARGRGDGLSTELVSAASLFDEGNAALREGHCAEAVVRYDRISEEFASSRFVSPSLYNAALCLQGQGDWSGAAVHYARLLEVRPDSGDAKHAQLQLAECLERLERWTDGVANAEAALRRSDLTAAERLEMLARRARAVLGAGDLVAAGLQARECISYYRTRTASDRIADEYFVAMASFVLAESIRLRGEQIAFPAGDVLQQHAVLDQRAQLILDAQGAYFDTIRWTNAEWAAAAGYRIGGMYATFFDAITSAPVPSPPRPMNEAQRSLYEASYREQLRARVLPLLRHAVRYWELTLSMVERTRVDTPWSNQVRADLERIQRALALPGPDSREEPTSSERSSLTP